MQANVVSQGARFSVQNAQETVSQAPPGTQWESSQRSHTFLSWIWGRGAPILGKDTKRREKEEEKGKKNKDEKGIGRYLTNNGLTIGH